LKKDIELLDISLADLKKIVIISLFSTYMGGVSDPLDCPSNEEWERPLR